MNSNTKLVRLLVSQIAAGLLWPMVASARGDDLDLQEAAVIRKLRRRNCQLEFGNVNGRRALVGLTIHAGLCGGISDDFEALTELRTLRIPHHPGHGGWDEVTDDLLVELRGLSKLEYLDLTSGKLKRDRESAGINRLGVEDERALRERFSRPSRP